MKATPLMIDLNEKKAVIVGGGKVAARRARVLIDSGALVTVVSPHVHSELEVLLPFIVWQEKLFHSVDVKNAFLVVVAVDDTLVQEQVLKAAADVPLVNCASDASQGNVHFPGHFSRGKLTFAISTHGASPTLTTQIKQDLEQKYTVDYEGYVDFLYEFRKCVKEAFLPDQVKQRLLKKALEPDFFTGNEQVRLWKELAEEEDDNDRNGGPANRGRSRSAGSGNQYTHKKVQG